MTQTAATTRAFAEQGGYDVDAGRDFLGVGAGSVVAGLVGSFPVDASPPRTGALVTAGGRTQAGALGAAAVVVLLIPFAGVLKDVPLATLAAILIYIAFRLFNGRDLARHLPLQPLRVRAGGGDAARRRADRGGAGHRGCRRPGDPRPHPPQLPAPAARHGAHPGDDELGPPGAGPHRRTCARASSSRLFATPIWYANAVHFRDEVSDALGEAPEPVRAFVLDAMGMSDIDFTGTRAMRQVIDRFERDGIAFGIARAGVHLRDSLRRSGLAARIGEDHFFSNVNEAVTALAAGPPPSS